MDLYLNSLCAITLANSIVLYLLLIQNHVTVEIFSGSAAKSRLGLNFMLIYALVLGADWLQGSFFYAVYREAHGLPDKTVGRLSAAGFAAAGLSATFIGSLADRYGRKKACLGYCVFSVLSCVTVLVHDLRVLFAGRLFGGVGTTLLYSVFEPWFLSELDRLCNNSIERENISTNMFSLLSILNGLIAIGSGVFSQCLVAKTGSTKSPFIASAVLLMFSALLIQCRWTENYGHHTLNMYHEILDTIRLIRGTWGSMAGHGGLHFRVDNLHRDLLLAGSNCLDPDERWCSRTIRTDFR
ncbi:hypothetical protein PFICI_08705 [Pestalotiopsis fici W106-1]|uniref:Molybdate-anion transporter n=1 Tax=Pestalotiopsis fici (strain W106-1 / CGMCC3.15140) TaxID=1229662 RepID=W3X0G6_PESFW|nr:uncharacterized protein PFICI_08705 [Pestalotiopsis fici W106-1]ETS78852.1 hypothetical protein PFICI_08705 [Pestalotiopsis fici W106-1]